MAQLQKCEPLAVADDGSLARPDFLIVGAAKSGTTSLWSYLRQHPQVYLPEVKEPNYFAFGPEGPTLHGPVEPEVLVDKLYSRCVTDPSAYARLFQPAEPGQVKGEASVRYLYYPQAAPRIAAALPDARLVAVLRDPVDRVVSHYTMNRAAGLEPLDLESALAAEDDRVRADWGWDWHYTRVSRYGRQVAHLLEHVPREHLLVVDYAHFQTQPLAVYAQVCRHLGITDDFVPDMSRRIKEISVPRSRWAERVLSAAGASRGLRAVVPSDAARQLHQRLRRANRAARPSITDDLRHQLSLDFADDVATLEELLGQQVPSLHPTR